MKRFQIILFPLLIGATIMSCKTSAILSSNFESETIGNLPAKNIPGDPSGDAIDYSSELEPRIKVTASASAGEKALTFSEISTPGLTAHNQFLTFKGISTDFTQPMWFLFTATHSGTGERIMIDITDGSAALISRMYIDQSGNLSLVTALPGTEQAVGNIGAGVLHTIIVSLNLTQKKYNVTVLKSGGNITLTDKPVLVDNILAYANPARPSLHFRFESGASPDRKYVLESVSITKKRP
jgi:hypothetical protein